MRSITWLDLRLMLTRQPGIAFLLCGLLGLTGWLLIQPPQTQPAETGGGVDAAHLAAAQQNFRSLLIPPEKLAASQQALLDAAASHSLSIGQVDYSKEDDTTGGFSQVTMRLPVAGRYSDIRIFIEELMATQPALSLRQLSIERDSKSDVSSTLTATLTAQFLVGDPLR